LGAAALKKLGVPAGKPIVLAAGMRRPHKGFDIFLKAAASLKAKAHFVLLGDVTPSEAAHEALLKKLAQVPELKGRLTVLPASPTWRLDQAGLGFPVLLALGRLALGGDRGHGLRAAIVATAQGSGEILKDGLTGWLAQSEDAEGLASQMAAALKSPAQRAKRGRAAKAEAGKRFSLKAYVQDLMALYDSL